MDKEMESFMKTLDMKKNYRRQYRKGKMVQKRRRLETYKKIQKARERTRRDNAKGLMYCLSQNFEEKKFGNSFRHEEERTYDG